MRCRYGSRGARPSAPPQEGYGRQRIRLPGRTPLLFMDVPGDSNDTVPLYGLRLRSIATLPAELRDRPLVKKPVTLGSLKKAVAMARTGMRIVR